MQGAQLSVPWGGTQQIPLWGRVRESRGCGEALHTFEDWWNHSLKYSLSLVIHWAAELKQTNTKQREVQS